MDLSDREIYIYTHTHTYIYIHTYTQIDTIYCTPSTVSITGGSHNAFLLSDSILIPKLLLVIVEMSPSICSTLQAECTFCNRLFAMLCISQTSPCIYWKHKSLVPKLKSLPIPRSVVNIATLNWRALIINTVRFSERYNSLYVPPVAKVLTYGISVWSLCKLMLHGTYSHRNSLNNFDVDSPSTSGKRRQFLARFCIFYSVFSPDSTLLYCSSEGNPKGQQQ